MSRRITIETSTSGQQYVTLKRSHSHHHHHHHRHGHHDHPSEYVRLKRDDWNLMVERERSLEASNKSLQHQVDDLKARLCALQGGDGHLRHTIQQLECQVVNLTDDNAALRRSLDSATSQLSDAYKNNDKLQCKVDQLEKSNHCLKKENSDLKAKLSRLPGDGCVGELRREVEHWKERMAYWKANYDDLLERYNETCHILDCRTEKMKAYEDILKRRNIIC